MLAEPGAGAWWKETATLLGCVLASGLALIALASLGLAPSGARRRPS